MLEVIILEDDPGYQGPMERMVPEGMTVKIVETSEALRAALAECSDSTIFILDDRVPSAQGQKPGYHFLENAQNVITANPTAKIVYTGTSPGSEEMKFCHAHGIQMTEKWKIRDLIANK